MSAISKKENDNEYEYKTEFIISNPKKETVSLITSPFESFTEVMF